MSKRVLIILGVGFLFIVGAFFLHKKETSDLYEVEPEPDEKSEPKPRKAKTTVVTEKKPENGNIQEETGTTDGNQTA